jgi:hypothetical protein
MNIENHIACSGCGSPVVVREAIGKDRICAACAGERLAAADALAEAVDLMDPRHGFRCDPDDEICVCGIYKAWAALDAYRAACKTETTK